MTSPASATPPPQSDARRPPDPLAPDPFIAALHAITRGRDEGFSDARAVLAELRRGLREAPQWSPRTLRRVLPLLSRRHLPTYGRDDEDAFLLTATAFAHHPSSSPGGEPLAAALRRVHQERNSDSIERRFMALLAAGPEELPLHLRHVVGLIAAAGITIDWNSLLRDLRDLASSQDDRPDRVRRRWAEQYWRHEAQPAEEGPADSKAHPAATAAE